MTEYLSKIRTNLNDSKKTYHPNKINRMLNGSVEKLSGYLRKNLSDTVSANRNFSLWFGDYDKTLDEKSVNFRNRKIAANLDLIAFPFYKYDPLRKRNGITLMFEDDGSIYTYPYRDLTNISSEMVETCTYPKYYPNSYKIDGRCFKK